MLPEWAQTNSFMDSPQSTQSLSSFTQEEQNELARSEFILETFHIPINYRTLPNECREFLGNTDREGYPIIRHKHKQYRAHRLLWQHTHSTIIPLTLTMRRLCGLPACVNLSHYILTRRIAPNTPIDFSLLLYDDPD